MTYGAIKIMKINCIQYPGYCGSVSQTSSIDCALMTQLQETHLSYLNTEDSPDKLDLRKEMDGQCGHPQLQTFIVHKCINTLW